MIRELVLATHNRHKAEELTALLEGLGITIRTLDEFLDVPEVVEDGDTCEANAVKKARAIAEFTGLPAVADDTGLEVDALGGRPGIYAARYAGEGATYEDNCRKLLSELMGVPQEQRTARFLTVAALALPSEGIRVVKGTLDGVIAEPRVSHPRIRNDLGAAIGRSQKQDQPPRKGLYENARNSGTPWSTVLRHWVTGLWTLSQGECSKPDA
jgi:XTP/dITP diphosphohydrolase